LSGIRFRGFCSAIIHRFFEIHPDRLVVFLECGGKMVSPVSLGDEKEIGGPCGVQNGAQGISSGVGDGAVGKTLYR